MRIELKGGEGGHSGIEIAKTRANALKVVADRFRQVTKEWSGQQVFRYGGDAFRLLLFEDDQVVGIQQF